MSDKVWFITGASRGFGRVWTDAALSRGDKVVATARDVRSLGRLAELYGDGLLPLPLDVTDRSAVLAAVAQAHAHFGRLDTVICNAGYGFFGAVEEAEEAQARAQMETNFFGALWTIQGALPFLRQQGHGKLLVVTSVGGVIAFPTSGLYAASKWALEGLCEALTKEVADFGIKVTLVEPAGYDTDWRGSSAQHATKMDAYATLREKLTTHSRGRLLGDPAATAKAILSIADSEDPPPRLLLGRTALSTVEKAYTDRLTIWREWASVTNDAQGDVGETAH